MRDPQHSSPLAQTTTDHKQQRTGLGCSLLLLALLVGVVATLVLLAPRALAMLANQAVTTPSQLTDRTSPEAMIAQREAAAAQLNTYGWVDQAANVAHIPIARAIALIAEQGLPVGSPAAAVTADQPITTAAPQNAPAAIEPTQVDFQRDVLPIFEQRCNDCHGFEEPEEGLVLTGYKSVLQGSQNGPVITPGDPDKSYLVELIVKGKMPKRGKKLTPAEIATITAWVKGGALETAADPSSSSASAAITPTQAVTKTVAVKTPAPTPTATVTALEPDQVDFQRDVLPIFQQRCNDCHGFEEAEEDLVLTSYRSVLQGSKNGPVIEPGDPDKSYLVELIVKGKMPKRGKKLTVEEIATITAWVKGGALEKAADPSSSSASVPVTPTQVVTKTVAVKTPVSTPTATVTAIDPTEVDFQRDVLPIFEQRCNDCHGFEEPEEDLVLTGYRSVTQGSKNGPVIAPGDPDKSLLVELIVNGKMPKRGKKLTPEEIAIITAWVKGGALEKAAAGSAGGGATPPPSAAITATVTSTVTGTPKATPSPATANVDPATVSFQNDVLPIFEQRCSDCHGFEEPEEGLVLTGYRSVLGGSDKGPVITPGDPDQSLLVELIVNGKMPKRGKKLTPAEIAIITAWVKGGARDN